MTKAVYAWCEYGTKRPRAPVQPHHKRFRKRQRRDESGEGRGVHVQLRAPRLRCPKCNRLLRLRSYDMEPFAAVRDPEWQFPRHKKRVKRGAS